MSHIFHVPDEIYRKIVAYAAQHGQNPDALLMAWVKKGVEQLNQAEPTTSRHEALYDPAHDPLAPFIGAFDSGEDDPGWIERHDSYFAGNPASTRNGHLSTRVAL
jgi:hypothetical protein